MNVHPFTPILFVTPIEQAVAPVRSPPQLCVLLGAQTAAPLRQGHSNSPWMQPRPHGQHHPGVADPPCRGQTNLQPSHTAWDHCLRSVLLGKSAGCPDQTPLSLWGSCDDVIDIQ